MAYGNLKEGDNGLDVRIKYALNWIEDFGEPDVERVELTAIQSKAIDSIIKSLKNASNEEEFQSSVFEVAKIHQVRPGNLFRLLYSILLGKPNGPRFGPFVATIGKDAVIGELEKSLK